MSLSPDDDLLQKAERLKKQSDSFTQTRKKAKRDSAHHELGRHVKDTQNFFVAVYNALKFIYSCVLKPVSESFIIRKPLQFYRYVWVSAVYKPDPEDQNEEIFSKKRAGIMMIVTAVMLYCLPGFLMGTAEFTVDSVRMATTYKKDEIWYLGRSQEIDVKGNVFSAQGCASIRCTDQTSIYFRIKPSLAHHLWSLVKNGNIFFPDFVAAGIQNDINKCKVTGYGVRWKFLVRNWDVYPQILSVDCIPLTGEEIERMDSASISETSPDMNDDETDSSSKSKN